MSNLNQYLDHKLVQFKEYNARATGKFNEIAYNSFYKKIHNMRGGEGEYTTDGDFNAQIAALGADIDEGTKTQLGNSVDKFEKEMENVEGWFLGEWETRLTELEQLLDELNHPNAKNFLIKDTIQSYIRIIKNATDEIKKHKQTLNVDVKKSMVPLHGGSKIVKYNSYNNKANEFVKLIIDLNRANNITKSKINRMLGGSTDQVANVAATQEGIDKAINDIYNKKRDSLVAELHRINESIEALRNPEHVEHNERTIAGLDKLVSSLITKVSAIPLFDADDKFKDAKYTQLLDKIGQASSGKNVQESTTSEPEEPEDTGLPGPDASLTGGRRRKSSKKSSKRKTSKRKASKSKK